MIYRLLLAQLVLLLWVGPQEGGSIEITRPPQDQTVCVGDNVTITCGFDGIEIRPNWIIDNITFGNSDIMANNMLYVPDVTNTTDTVLIMLSVTASMNGTRTQCELNTLDSILSSTAVLTIMGTPLRPNLIVTEIALDSFTVSWNTFSHDACGGVVYNIRLFKGLQLIIENITDINNISFAGLNDTTLYGVSMFATNNAGPGSPLNINVTTLTPAVPSPPKQLKVNKLFINYEPIVWITWTPPLLTRNMTEIEAYNVTLYDKDQLLSFTILQSQTVFNLSEEDVKLNIRETYTISISAINSVGYSTEATTTFELQWLQSATISLSPDNKTIVVTCEVTEASPQVECLVTINCPECLNSPNTTEFFRGSIQLAVPPADLEDYVVTVQAVRADNNDPLEEYIITKTLQIPKTSKPSDNPVLGEDSEDDEPIWIYIVIAVAVLIVIVLGILMLSIICYCIMKKRKGHSIGHDDEKKRGGINGYTRHSDSSTLTSPVTEKDQTEHHTKNGLDNGKISFYSETTITNSDKEVTIALPSDPSDSPVSIKQESYSQVDLTKKHNKTNYVELGAFNTKQPTVMPMGAPHVKYTEVKIQSNQNKQENSS